MTEEQRTLLDKADQAIQLAHVLLETGDVDGAFNRAYYAAFYAATAALCGRDESPKSHAGTQTRFSFHFVRTGLIAQATGVLFKSIFSDRQRVDYDALSIFDTRAAADALTDAERFVAAVRPLVT